MTTITDDLPLVAFVLSAAAVGYAYVGYPFVIWLCSRVFGVAAPPPVVRSEEEWQTMTLLVAAYNEEAVIGERVRDALAMDYPPERLRVVIASDGSTDGTAAAVKGFADPRVRLLNYRERRGKAAVLNAAMTEVETDLVVLSDANTGFAPGAARNLARWFHDPAVGIVCGRLVLTDPATGENADGLYWRCETFLKTCEARLGALLGSNGAIYAMRRNLFVPIPCNTIVDDFVIPLAAKLRSGCRIVYDADAVATEESAADVRDEFWRRVRIGAGGFQAIVMLWRVLSPRYGWLAFAFLSHKVLRWLCPFALLTMLLTAAAAAPSRSFFECALAVQIVFYGLSVILATFSSRKRLPRGVRLVTMFTGMNAALFVGFLRWLGGIRTGAWERTARAARTPATATPARPPRWRDVITRLPLVRQVHSRGIDRWIVGYAASTRRRRPPEPGQPIHVLLCIADHYEPQAGRAAPDQAAARVERWVREYPRQFDRLLDSDGRPPQHTFFFPIDEYVPSHVERLAGLCRRGYGEVEIHHHHNHDTGEALRERLELFKRLFRERHGLLPHDPATGEVKYGFVHGNWALDNSLPDGRWCGVNNELDVLRETGCYADFTLPSAPSRAQTRKINSIYYATDDPRRPKSHDRGIDVGGGPRPPRSLMLVQGPLLLDWRRGHGPMRVVPRIENANIQANQPPTIDRLELWLRARVQVRSRPDWFFVKLHTHGATEPNQQVLLGGPMVRFHESLGQWAAERGARLHYVTAREMYNLARAAEQGWTGSVADARDAELFLPERRHTRRATGLRTLRVPHG
jgi:cellulose synthase/poly-beta-1,6-N-acetylglucosamine synthase-like glycosyltransferase